MYAKPEEWFCKEEEDNLSPAMPTANTRLIEVKIRLYTRQQRVMTLYHMKSSLHCARLHNRCTHDKKVSLWSRVQSCFLFCINGFCFKFVCFVVSCLVSFLW